MAVRRLALITENPRKAEEWAHHLRPQGVTCIQISAAGRELSEVVAGLQEKGEFPLICREESLLIRPSGEQVVSFRHLALVDHLCTVEAWYLKDERWMHQRFEARREGYLDTTGALESGGWWDACFRDAKTGMSYQEQSLKQGGKVSARSQAIDQVVEFFAPEPRQARHLGLSFQPQVVDLSRSVRQDVLRNGCFQTLRGSFLEPMVENALSRGLFTTIGRTRSQQVYFWPGLSGLPSVPRESEVDEAKFLFHDLIHFLIGRLVPCGEMTEHQRRVFVTWAMVEEAVALMLADGYFVDHLNSSGVDYDFEQHKGYPFFCALDLAGRPVERDELREVLWANVCFFVLGDRREFGRLGLDFDDPRARAYLDGFERFAMGDWLWNERMSLHARADAEFYARWWSLAGRVNERAGLEIQTVQEAAAKVEGSTPREIARGVFELVEKRLFSPPQADISDEQEKARWRWLVGQLGFFANFHQLDALRRAGELAADAMDFEPLPDFLNQAMKTAVEAGLCTAHQALWWKDFYPLFPPYYISYKARPGLTLNALAQRIMGEEGGARELEIDLGAAVAVVCNTSKSRFLLERKTAHPNPLCEGRFCLVGGFRIRPDEPVAVAWRREANEEWTDAESRVWADRLADVAVPWRRFRLHGVEYPGDYEMDVLVSQLPDEEFHLMAQTLTSGNSPETRPEGWPTVIEREKLFELPMLSGHYTVLEEFVSSPTLSFSSSSPSR